MKRKKEKKVFRDLIKECSVNGFITTDCTFFLFMGYEDKKLKPKPSDIDSLYIKNLNLDE